MSYLVTEKLTKYFGDTHAVDKVDFVIGEGEVVALIGSNGAGGRIVFRGEDVTRQPVQDRIKAGIARSFQIVNLFDELTVVDNVALSIFAREGKTRWFFTLADHYASIWEEAHDILRQFGLDLKAKQLAGGISQGERKLLDVAVAYALKPQLLFLDEPTSGVSTREKAPIMDVISSIVRSQRITAVVIEHDMDIIFKYSDRIVVMHQGLILASGSPEEIRSNESVKDAVFGPTHA